MEGLFVFLPHQTQRVERGRVREEGRSSFGSDLKLGLIGEALRHSTVLYKCKLEIALGLRHLGQNK